MTKFPQPYTYLKTKTTTIRTIINMIWTIINIILHEIIFVAIIKFFFVKIIICLLPLIVVRTMFQVNFNHNTIAAV